MRLIQSAEWPDSSTRACGFLLRLRRAACVALSAQPCPVFPFGFHVHLIDQLNEISAEDYVSEGVCVSNEHDLLWVRNIVPSSRKSRQHKSRSANSHASFSTVDQTFTTFLSTMITIPGSSLQDFFRLHSPKMFLIRSGVHWCHMSISHMTNQSPYDLHRGLSLRCVCRSRVLGIRNEQPVVSLGTNP